MAERKILTIKTYMEKDDVVLAVADQGEGINPEVLEKLGTHSSQRRIMGLD